MRHPLSVRNNLEFLVREIDELLTNPPREDIDGYWRHANAAIQRAYEVVLGTSGDRDANKVIAANVGLHRERLAMRFEDVLQSCHIRDYEGIQLDWARVKTAL